jgi:hypothetical protein
MNSESLMLIGGGVVLTLAVVGGRQRCLREKYVLAWIGVGLVQMACGLLASCPSVCGLSGPSAAVLVGLGTLYMFSYTISVSLTHQYRLNVQLNQEVALLERRLYHVETTLAPRLGRKSWVHRRPVEGTSPAYTGEERRVPVSVTA